MAAPSAPGRGSEDARSPVMMGASSRKRRRRDRLSRLRTTRCAVSAAVGCVAIAMGLLPSGAQAAQAHYFTEAFGAPGAGAGQLSLLAPGLEEKEVSGQKFNELKSPGSGLAVDEATGDVYVADTGNHRVDEFSASGTFIRAWGWGVEDGSPELQTCTTATTCQAGIPGTGPGQFEAPTFIAVDNSPAGGGDVYVADTADHLITRFDPEGALITGWGVEGRLGTAPIVVATGTANLTAGSTELTGLTEATGRFEQAQEVVGEGIPAGTFLESPGGILRLSRPATITKAGVALTARLTIRQPDGLAVDPSGDLLALAGRLFEFDPSGAYLRAIATGGEKPGGLSVDGTGAVYLVEGLGAVEKIDSAGATVGRVLQAPSNGGAATTGLAASTTHDDLYVDQDASSIGNVSSRCEPAQGVCSPVQVFGEGHLEGAAGLALDSSTGTLYAADAGADQVATFAVSVEATAEAATDRTATTATVHGKVNPEGAELERCRFEYGLTIPYENSVPCAESNAQVGSGTAPVSVEAPITGLVGGATYHFRLRAATSRPGVEGHEALSDDGTFETLAIPTIDEAGVEALTATTATLKAKIDPHGLDTRYRFQYGPCATASTCTTSPYPDEAPAGGEDIGSGTADVSRTALIEGLEPNLTYHFRVLATSTNGTATGPQHTFVFLTQPIPQPETPCANEALRQANGSTALPDCRAYELVTPAKKNGALIGATFGGGIPHQISSDGLTVMAISIQCFADAQSCTGTRGNSEGDPFEFTRTPSGWITKPLAPPVSLFQTASWQGFNPTTHTVLYSAPSPPSGQDDFYVRSPDGSFVDIGPIAEGDESLFSGLLASRASSGDYSRVVYSAERPFWAFDKSRPTANSLYEYVGTGNAHPLLIGVSGGFESESLISACGIALGGAGEVHSSYGSLSADSRTLFFGASPCDSGSGANAGDEVPAFELFARIDGESSTDARTVAISQPDALSPAPPNEACTSAECKANTAPVNQNAKFRDAYFEGASDDGSRVYFTSTQQLTDDAGQDPSQGDSARGRSLGGCLTTTGANGCNLYLYDFGAPEGHHLIDVSAGAQLSGGPKVQGSVAISPDGTHVYFVAKGVLTEAPNSQGRVAVEGAENLYLYQRDATDPAGALTFVAGLSPSDQELDWESFGTQGIGRANVTPDGRYLVFESHRGLTSDTPPGEGPAQIYRFDAQTETLTRISIATRGFGDDGNSGLGDATIVAAVRGFSGGSGPAKANPTMSDDGRYVFFQSPKALTPGALDDVRTGATLQGGGPELAQNIYEWQAQGVGGCQEAGGCVSLLSDGKEVIEGGKVPVASPELLGTDPSGQDVFIAAKDRLTWADTDSQRDYYDLRVGGGFAPPAEPPICHGDACTGQGTGPGTEQSPATPNFSGPSEGPKTPSKTSCKKGFVKKHGKCVKQHSKKHHAKKHHKKSKKRHAKSNRGGWQMTAAFRVSPSISVPAVSALDPSQRAAMACAGPSDARTQGGPRSSAAWADRGRRSAQCARGRQRGALARGEGTQKRSAAHKGGGAK